MSACTCEGHRDYVDPLCPEHGHEAAFGGPQDAIDEWRATAQQWEAAALSLQSQLSEAKEALREIRDIQVAETWEDDFTRALRIARRALSSLEGETNG